ncbi:armadillo-type protein [Amylostereum chailletii]|nr:armadillo-type protein [Amylostereum chailletii]
MPKDFRKRGKRHKKTATDTDAQPHHTEDTALEPKDEHASAGPSWIVSAPNENQANIEAPFGYVDADIKAYFRTVDTQLKEWQENGKEIEEEGGDTDPNENKRMFLLAALQEMSGKERELATDPDCSTVLERMTYSMDDFVRRVFMDSLSGSYEQLAKHRFASHVIQTLLTVVSGTASRELRGVLPSIADAGKGELRTATQLVVDIAKELLPSLSTLVLDPFASHVVRALFVLLCPGLFPGEASSTSQSALRSKKSAAWKAKQGTFKSVFSEDSVKGKNVPLEASPPEFRAIAKQYIEALRNDLDENEVRAMAANKASSPVLQMILKVETDLGMADEPGSLVDRVLVGMITLHYNDPTAIPDYSDYLGTLLRDPTSSHLLETLVSCCPPPIFAMLWSTYFSGTLAKLAVHPVANFVVAKALERATSEQLGAAVAELGDVWKRIRTSRPGVLKALVDRVVELKSMEAEICESQTMFKAFEVEEEDQAIVVQCILRLQTPREYREAVAAAKGKSTVDDGDHSNERTKRRPRRDAGESPLEPKVAGAPLLQSLLKLSAPHNEIVLKSIQAMSVDDVISLAHHAMSSRVLDALLESATISPKHRRAFIMKLIGHYHRLVDDRIGSRVGDRCWGTADTFLKEKIARSLVTQEAFLSGSYYGKFFARNLNLYLLQRRPDEWRNLQTSKTSQPTKPTTAPIPQAQVPSDDSSPTKKKRKRGDGAGDVIDELFDKALGKKIKKGSLSTDVPFAADPPNAQLAEGTKRTKRRDAGGGPEDDLGTVLGAIRQAPKGEEKVRRKKHKA